MDTNCAKDGLRYYKEQIPNYQHSLPCNEVYPEAYGLKNDVKDRRVYPTGPLYYQSNYKPDVSYRENKTVQPKASYVDYGPSSFKDSSYPYPYYDQYKYNVAPINNVPQLPKTVNYQSYQTNPIMNTSMNTAFYEENNMRAKAPNMNYHQYNYSNFYGYSGPSQPSPNLCGYGYTEESRLLWEDYQNNRTYPPSYVHANPAIKEPINHITYPSVLRSREKPVCVGNTPRLHNSTNHCNSGVAWPTHFPYQPVAQNYRSSCNKLYCHEDHQNPNFCVVRHEKPELYQNYKYLQSQHIPPYRTAASDMCAVAPPAPVYYESKVETPYHSGLVDYQAQNGVVYHKPVTSEPQKRSYNYPQQVESVAIDPNYNQFQVYDERVTVQTNYAQETNVYDTTGQSGVMTKRQNLREFLSSWNEDEDDGTEKLGVGLENCQFLEETVLEQKNNEEKEVNTVDSSVQFNGQYGKVRPKIHVGITVDSNIPNDQYINLPDIIIDIEKSKDPQDSIAQPEEPRNVVLFEPIDVSIAEIKEYKDTNNITENSCASSNTSKPQRTKGGKIKVNKQSKKRGSFCLKVKRRKFSCKVRGIKRSIILKNCCKSMAKRKNLIYSKKSFLKEKFKRSPPTLKSICISSLNSKIFQEYILANYENSTLQNSSVNETNEMIVQEIETCIPKLSALCENALNEYYEKGVLVINIEEDVDSRLYFLECDINENVLESNENDGLTSVDYGEDSGSTIPINQNDIVDSHETIKDFNNSIHHEEIIPDNFKLFESKKFLQYLQDKYVRNNSILKGYITKKILSKYKKRGLRTDRHKTKSLDQRT